MQIVFIDMRDYFEITVFEMSRVDCIMFVDTGSEHKPLQPTGREARHVKQEREVKQEVTAEFKIPPGFEINSSQ